MDLIDGMRAFAQVVATGSFTKAGERLGVSKKLVSKYVQQLEDRLLVRLLHRTTRSLSLTEEGALYYSRCVQLLDDLDELELSLQSKIDLPKGRLFVSAPVTFGEMHLIPQMNTFHKQFPNVTLDIRLNDRFVNLVDEGFDVAIRIGVLEETSLVARKLATAGMVLCASPEYLKNGGIPKHPEHLRDHDIIVDTNFRSGSNWPFVIEGTQVNIPVTGTFSVNSARSARDIALQGGGIAICPTYVVKPDIHAGRLVQLLADQTAFDLNIYVVYNKNRYLAPKVRAFVDFLSKACKALEE